MKNTQKGFASLVLIGIIILLGIAGYFVWSKKVPSQKPVSTTSIPATCKDEEGGIPAITSLSAYSVQAGGQLEIRGCNFAGFEGDKNAWIENSEGIKGILYGEAGSTAQSIKVTLPSSLSLCQKDVSYSGLSCDAMLTLAPGAYKVYVSAWGKESNKIDFTILPTDANFTVGKVTIDSQQTAEIQKAVDEGHSPWHLDPEVVAEVAIYPDGIANYNANFIEKVSFDTEKGIAVYWLPFESKLYQVTLVQPVIGKDKIWVVSDIIHIRHTE